VLAAKGATACSDWDIGSIAGPIEPVADVSAVTRAFDLHGSRLRDNGHLTLALFLVDPTLAFSVLRIPDQQPRCHHRHQNDPQEFPETEIDTGAESMDHCHNYAD